MRRNTRSPQALRLIVAIIRLFWQNPSLFMLTFICAGGWYAYEYSIARPTQVFQGVPETRDWRDFDSWFRVLRNHGFILGYSDLRGNPLWVMYSLHPIESNAQELKRPSRFSPDWRGLNRVSHDSYTRSGYDRGHMAPNHAMSRLYGAQAQADSFLMTNITPQKANLNQKWWQRLESAEIDRFAKQYGQVWVVTGPVFDDRVERLKSSWIVEIPDAFYKIYVAQIQPGKLVSLAFLVPQTVNGKEPLDQYVTNIDNIEAKTGLDFFPNLDDKTEAALESGMDTRAWHLQEIAKLPGRY